MNRFYRRRTIVYFDPALLFRTVRVIFKLRIKPERPDLFGVFFRLQDDFDIRFIQLGEKDYTRELSVLKLTEIPYEKVRLQDLLADCVASAHPTYFIVKHGTYATLLDSVAYAGSFDEALHLLRKLRRG